MLTILPNQPHPPLLTVCDGQMQLDVNFEPPGEDFADNVHFSLAEKCPPQFKLFVADEIGFTLTSAEARILANALLEAAKQNDAWLAKNGNRP